MTKRGKKPAGRQIRTYRTNSAFSKNQNAELRFIERVFDNRDNPGHWSPDNNDRGKYYPPSGPPAPPANPTGAGGSSTPVHSTDPNAKFGPAGYGSQGFIDATSTLPYQVDFENDPTATAPAQQVVVTDQLDSNLDWKTLQFTAVGFGNNIITIPADTQHYQTTVPMTYNGQTFDVDIELGLNADTGQVFARFQSIDPNTSLPPSNVLVGFLPPEDGTGRGQGYFSYTVQPKAGSAHRHADSQRRPGHLRRAVRLSPPIRSIRTIRAREPTRPKSA